MWQQTYMPLADSLALSTVAAAVPIFVLLLLIGVMRKPAWVAALAGLIAALFIAIGIYGMPTGLAVSSATNGAASQPPGFVWEGMVLIVWTIGY